MELNTAVSVISEQTYKTTWNAVKASHRAHYNMQLHMYTGDTIPVRGMVECYSKPQTVKQPLYTSPGS